MGIRDIYAPIHEHNQIQLLIQNIKLFIFGWAQWQSGARLGQRTQDEGRAGGSSGKALHHAA